MPLDQQESLFRQLAFKHKDQATKKVTQKSSKPNRYVFKFENEKFETHGFGTLTNTVIYATEDKIKRLNVD